MVLYTVKTLLDQLLPGDHLAFSKIILQYGVFFRSENLFGTKQLVLGQCDGAEMIGGYNQPIMRLQIAGDEIYGV